MRIGFIGLGNLGGPMAANLVKAGHQLTVRDLDAARQVRFAADHGARAARGLADIADNEFVFTVLPTGPIVRKALTEEEGGAFLAAVKPGTVVVDMTSSEPLGTRELGAILRQRGVALIDAPVSKRTAAFVASAAGTTPGAASGALAIMIGADDEAALARAKPVLAALGDTLFETGPLGSGHATKTLNNYASAAAHAALGEAMLIGQRFGLDPATTIEIINVSTGRSFISEVLFRNKLANPNFATGFSVGLMAKDVTIAADLAKAMGVDAPVARAVDARWAEARARTGYDADVTNAMKGWEEAAE